MSKVAVVYWSASGSTQTMAEEVAAGASEKGAEVQIFDAAAFRAEMVPDYDGIAFGCPAMGAEQLESSEFEPMFDSVEPALSGKPIALFGSYGWGDGTWMRDWEDRCRADGAVLASESVIANYAPGEEEKSACRALGAALA